jgi:hypothetical protein
MARTPFWGAILMLIYPELRYACSGLQAHTPSGGGMRKFLVCMIENRLKPLSIFLEKNQKNDAIFLMPPRG